MTRLERLFRGLPRALIGEIDVVQVNVNFENLFAIAHIRGAAGANITFEPRRQRALNIAFQSTEKRL